MPTWLVPLVSFLSALAAVGLVLSAVSHFAAVLGIRGPLGDYAWVLHIGVFIVWLPTVLVARNGRHGLDQWR